MKTQKIIDSSLKILGILSSGESATSDMSQDALESLKMLLDNWQMHNLLLTKEDERYWKKTGVDHFTIGNSSSYDFNETAPLDIVQLWVRDSGGSDYYLNRMSDVDWAKIGSKAVSGLPTQYWYKYNDKKMTIYFDMAIDSDYTVYALCKMPFFAPDQVHTDTMTYAEKLTTTKVNDTLLTNTDNTIKGSSVNALDDYLVYYLGANSGIVAKDENDNLALSYTTNQESSLYLTKISSSYYLIGINYTATYDGGYAIWNGTSWSTSILFSNTAVTEAYSNAIITNNNVLLQAYYQTGIGVGLIKKDSVGSWSYADLSGTSDYHYPVVVELNNGDIALFGRSATDGYLYKSISSDDGITWGSWTKTNISAQDTKFSITNTSSGLLAFIGRFSSSTTTTGIIQIGYSEDDGISLYDTIDLVSDSNTYTAGNFYRGTDDYLYYTYSNDTQHIVYWQKINEKYLTDDTYPTNTQPEEVEELTVDSDIDWNEGWVSALKYNLAVEIAPEYGVEPSRIVYQRAVMTLADIRRRYGKQLANMTFDRGMTRQDFNRRRNV